MFVFFQGVYCVPHTTQQQTHTRRAHHMLFRPVYRKKTQQIGNNTRVYVVLSNCGREVECTTLHVDRVLLDAAQGCRYVCLSVCLVICTTYHYICWQLDYNANMYERVRILVQYVHHKGAKRLNSGLFLSSIPARTEGLERERGQGQGQGQIYSLTHK